MKLEEIVKQYGYNDYYEMSTGRTYKLSKVIEENKVIKVPVYENGIFIGLAILNKAEV